MVLAKPEAGSSFATATDFTDFTAIEPHQALSWLQPRLSKDTEALYPTAPAKLTTSVSSKTRKRKRANPHPTTSMPTRRRTYTRGYDDGTTTSTSRSSGGRRRPESASRVSAKYMGKGPLSRLQQRRRRRPRSAIRTEYLGVSRIVFAPPLQRYLNSPQHGRHALRSSRATSPTRRVQSHSGPSGFLAGSAATMAGRRARGNISRSGEKLKRRGTVAASPEIAEFDDTSWCPLAPSGEPLTYSERSNVGVVGMGESPEISPPPGLLTPVGPDWMEGNSLLTSLVVDKHSQIVAEVARREEVSCPRPLEPGGCGVDGNILVHQPSLRETERASGVNKEAIEYGNTGVGTDSGSGSYYSSQEEQGSSGRSGERSCGTTQEGQPTEIVPRCGRVRRRAPRIAAWDLLTGRKMGRDRRKGSSGIHLPPVGVQITRMNIIHHTAGVYVSNATLAVTTTREEGGCRFGCPKNGTKSRIQRDVVAVEVSRVCRFISLHQTMNLPTSPTPITYTAPLCKSMVLVSPGLGLGKPLVFHTPFPSYAHTEVTELRFRREHCLSRKTSGCHRRTHRPVRCYNHPRVAHGSHRKPRPLSIPRLRLGGVWHAFTKRYKF